MSPGGERRDTRHRGRSVPHAHVPLPLTSTLSILAGIALIAVLLAPDADTPEIATAAGVVPLPVPASTRCDDLTPPLRGTGPVVPPPDGRPAELPDGALAEARGGALLAWRSPEPIRATIVAGVERAHLYWYEPPTAADTGLRAPADPDGGVGAVRWVELCRTESDEPDLAEVCIRAGHLPVTGVVTYADGTFDGTLGDRFVLAIDPDDGTLAWRSDGVPVTAVVTAASAPVLVEYDPPTTEDEDVPFLGTDGTTGRVLFCGIAVIDGIRPPSRVTPASAGPGPWSDDPGGHRGVRGSAPAGP